MNFLVLLAFFATAHARAVNISNTWVLPEEGFPVFYRYFRDRISWYEADAVCQFHHANLVTGKYDHVQRIRFMLLCRCYGIGNLTVDTTAQYDAVRAYLRELDISSAVWVGLIRSNPEGDFTWTDYRGLSGDGYWSSAPDPRTAPLCAAADPTADYRWEARACGGPTVASFICELPVPQWALGKEGCMVRALPALTILYLPESAAVQLTADCGLAGVKRLQCTGNVKREDLLKDLSCTEEVELSSTLNNMSVSSTTLEVTTVTENLETVNNISTEENTMIEHDNLSYGLVSTPLSSDTLTSKSTISVALPTFNDINDVVMEKNINLNIIDNNNLQSNDIPNLVNNDNILTDYKIQKMEDEENMQHKKLHDELARLGNFETIFTQPTDHFVPPLVIAKAKLNDDMTVLSLEEKHAQHFGTHKMLKHSKEQDIVLNGKAKPVASTEQPLVIDTLEILKTTERTEMLKEELKKEEIKNNLPKKYRGFDTKNANILKGKNKKEKVIVYKEIINATNSSFTHLNLVENATLTPITVNNIDETQNDSFIDLTVILREPSDQKEIILKINNETSVINIEADKDITVKNISILQVTSEKPKATYPEVDSEERSTLHSNTSNKLVIIGDKIGSDNAINKSKDIGDLSTISDITTKIPVFKDDFTNSSHSDVQNHSNIDDVNKMQNVELPTETTQHELISTNENFSYYTIINSSLSATFSTVLASDSKNKTESDDSHKEPLTMISVSNLSNANKSIDHDFYASITPTINDAYNMSENIDENDKDPGDLETIDDFQSPLLSAANEPLQRPVRSRRPKQAPNRINKFNPFRILG